MDVFKDQNLLEFSDWLKIDMDYKEYLASIKAKSDYKCTRCNHTSCQNRKNFSRQCNICGHIESATHETRFHKIKFGVRKAFFICFEMATTTKSLSESYRAVRFGITEKTARLFIHKITEAMKPSGNNLLNEQIHADKSVLGGREEGKTVFNNLITKMVDSDKMGVRQISFFRKFGRDHEGRAFHSLTQQLAHRYCAVVSHFLRQAVGFPLQSLTQKSSIANIVICIAFGNLSCT